MRFGGDRPAVRWHDWLPAGFPCTRPLPGRDCATLSRLLAIQHQAAASHAELRVAVPLASPVRRIMHITGLDAQLRLYPTAAHAAAASPALLPRIPAGPVREVP